MNSTVTLESAPPSSGTVIEIAEGLEALSGLVKLDDDVRASERAEHARSDVANDHELGAMERLWNLAVRSAEAGNPAFAAILFDEREQAVAEFQNAMSNSPDVLAHPEMLAARWMIEHGRPSGHTLWTIAQPCAMCSAALYDSGVASIKFAASAAMTDSYLELPPVLVIPPRDMFAFGHREIRVRGPFEWMANRLAAEGWPSAVQTAHESSDVSAVPEQPGKKEQ